MTGNYEVVKKTAEHAGAAFITPTNAVCKEINEYMLAHLPTREFVLKARDMIIYDGHPITSGEDSGSEIFESNDGQGTPGILRLRVGAIVFVTVNINRDA